ncbi:MAG: VanZ family protein [Pseudomonadota bacterium]
MRPLRWARAWLTGGIALVLLVVFLSVRPSSEPLSSVEHSDKFAHLLAYGALALWFSGVFRTPGSLLVAGALIALGIALEGVQALLPTRSVDVGDVLANALGVGLGVAAGAMGLGGWCRWIENRVL